MPRLTSSIASTFSNKIISGLWRSTYLMRPWKVCALPPLDFSACSTSSCLALVAFWRDISLQLVPTMRRFTPGTLHLLGTCSQQAAWAAPISKMSKKTQGASGALQRDSRSKPGTRQLSTIVANFAQAGSASTEEAWIHFLFQARTRRRKRAQVWSLTPPPRTAGSAQPLPKLGPLILNTWIPMSMLQLPKQVSMVPSSGTISNSPWTCCKARSPSTTPGQRPCGQQTLFHIFSQRHHQGLASPSRCGRHKGAPWPDTANFEERICLSASYFAVLPPGPRPPIWIQFLWCVQQRGACACGIAQAAAARFTQREGHRKQSQAASWPSCAGSCNWNSILPCHGTVRWVAWATETVSKGQRPSKRSCQ